MAEFLIAWLTTIPTNAEILAMIALMVGIRYWRTGQIQHMMGRKVMRTRLSMPQSTHEAIQDAWVALGIVLPYSILRAAGQVGWI